MSNATLDAEAVEIYWMPGCSSCLRLKEFVESTGLPFTAINVEAEPERATILKERGLRVPAMQYGDVVVNGVHLKTVAATLGVEYEPPAMLSPAELMAKYEIVNAALQRFIPQIPDEAKGFTLPDRDRDLFLLAAHAGCTMRYFVGKYEDEAFPGFFDDMEPHTDSREELLAYAKETLEIARTWWEQDGQYDPLDAVMQVYWGPRTLHEALEREVWHAAQHCRQIMLMLERLGVEVDGPLTEDDLAGLPLPKRVFD